VVHSVKIVGDISVLFLKQVVFYLNDEIESVERER
jgi:hypothetical protein